MLFFFFLLDIPKKEERDLKMLTIKCAKKKKKKRNLGTNHFPFYQSSRLEPHFHSHFRATSCSQSFWGFFNVRLLLNFLPSGLGFHFLSFPQFYCGCSLSFYLSLLIYVLNGNDHSKKSFLCFYWRFWNRVNRNV